MDETLCGSHIPRRNDCTKPTPCSIGKAKAAPDAQRGLPRGLYGEGGHAHREKTRPADLEDTVTTANAERICRTAYSCAHKEGRGPEEPRPSWCEEPGRDGGGDAPTGSWTTEP